MNVVFLGTPESAVPSLAALLAAGHAVPLVVTRPDRPAGRSGAPRCPAVKDAAVRAGLTVIQPDSVKGPEFREALLCARPEVLVVVAFGKILPAPVLEAARAGAVNVHFSLLPRYRGAAPVQWALANGEEFTGVTTMRMNARMDEGDVLLQREVAIEPGERAPSLTRRLAGVGAALLLETLERLADGSLVVRPQDPSLATYAHLLAVSDGEVDPGLTAGEIEARVRGFDPWPGVWLRRGARRIRIVEASADRDASTAEASGTVIGLEGDAVRIACGGGTVLAVHRVQPEDRRVMSARDAANGRHVAAGDLLERIPR